MHVFPEIKRLERKYAKELVVISVHMGKFDNEKESDCIRQAILRHDLEHPVVNDPHQKIWNAYGARAWPTFVLISPDGDVLDSASGELKFENFDQALSKLIPKFEGKIDRKPKVFSLEKSKEKDRPLAYPGKIVATEACLYIADTNHHRILVTDHSGKVLEAIGGPDEGSKDGDFKAARFFQPQGLALAGSALYVADTENHLIREIDFKSKTVRRIAGTGQQAYHREGTGDALKIPLNSPWDLALDGKRLFIAMAGDHQIWLLELDKGMIGPFSGDGGENIKDGPHSRARYAQPSGIHIAKGKLYVADSEVSAIREVDLDPRGSARTIVGEGLFEFGDKDGKGEEVRLQHVLAVHAHGGRVYVADAYNHKIKICDPATREVKTFLGDGKRGKEDGKAPRFYEPSGLWVAGDKLFIADQNNHAIRVCNLKTGEVSTLAVEKK